MTTITIPSTHNSQSICDIRAPYDREIYFAPGKKYAVILAAYYITHGTDLSTMYSTHSTIDEVFEKMEELGDYAYEVINSDGYTYDAAMFCVPVRAYSAAK